MIPPIPQTHKEQSLLPAQFHRTHSQYSSYGVMLAAGMGFVWNCRVSKGLGDSPEALAWKELHNWFIHTHTHTILHKICHFYARFLVSHCKGYSPIHYLGLLFAQIRSSSAYTKFNRKAPLDFSGEG